MTSSRPRQGGLSSTPSQVGDQLLARERRGLLQTVSSVLDVPMTILAFIWLVLLIIDFTVGLNRSLETANQVLWGLFIIQFILEFWIAPKKAKYLKKNWLTAVALVLPAFRLLRAFRALRFLGSARVGRSVRLLRWVTSMNRGMKATRRTLRRRGMSYVLALTVLICFVGAAGVYAFENPKALKHEGLAGPTVSTGIGNYGEAVWWTAMMLTTMGSDYFPKTTEGRIIAWLLAMYGFAIFGYITATVASLIIKADQSPKTSSYMPTESSSPGRASELANLRDLREALQRVELQLSELIKSRVDQS